MPSRLNHYILILFMFIPFTKANSQTTIPYDYKGNYNWVARGVMDGNLVETNYRNHGELARWQDIPSAVWPRTIGGKHSDGTALAIAGRVPAYRPANYYGNNIGDTVVTPVAINFRTAGVRRSPTTGELWTFLPLNNFLNPDRRNPVTGRFERIPAISDDNSSWPDFWPDKLDNPDDPGWTGYWNGYFGKGVFNADLESFYVIDDLSNKGYNIDKENDEPFSPFGIYYADPADSTIGGMGLQVEVRLLQWANVLAEDVMFMLYRINNVGGTSHDSLYFTHMTDYGLGSDENDDNASFDPQLDIAYGWDSDGVGTRDTGGEFQVGYMGFAFLESPAQPFDMLDNDEDGFTDERRDSGAGILIEGQANIRNYMESNYNIEDFERVYGPIEELEAYKAGRWWTGDENANWISYVDENDNGKPDEGEFLNDDSGIDGLTPNDFGYVAPDFGEADGIPQDGERDFDRTDIPESDQIGLRGFDLGVRPNYENIVIKEDHLIWQKIMENEFELGSEPPTESLSENEPFLLFLSGPVTLPPHVSDYFSLAWIFGTDRDDFFKNRITVQNIYDANYNFAQPPLTPTLSAVEGDGKVVLGWDSVSIRSFDRFVQEYDFEGYKLYRGTDPLLFDVKTITDVDGTPTFYEPIAQFDLVDGIKGTVPVLETTAIFDLGDDTGLQFFYVDEDVTNGINYYYAINAYDFGVIDSNGVTEIDPQETVFNIGVDAYYNVTGTSVNAKVVEPRSSPAGFITSGTEDDLSRITSGFGTGSMSIEIVDEQEVRYGDTYRVIFGDSAETRFSPKYYATSHYSLINISTLDTLFDQRPMEESTPVEEGFIMQFQNDETIGYDFDHIGWVGNYGEDNEMFNQDPREVDGYSTTWITTIFTDDSPNGELVPDNYELRWADEDIYYPPRFQTSIYLRDSINVVGYNLATGEETELLILDRNENGEFDVADELVIMEQKGAIRTLRHHLRFRVPSGAQNVAPGDGEVFRISNSKPFAEDDFFQFTLSGSRIDTDLAKEELENVAVVPNPYLGYSIFEPKLSEATSGRGERVVQFVGLPEKCTIRIFNVRGELIQTLEHDAMGTNQGSMEWDLRTRDGLDLAFGVYVYHVEAPGVGEKVGKLAIVK